MRVPFQELFEILRQVLLKIGFEPERAGLCARLFAESSRDGVYSHGLNRFPQFIKMIRSGVIDIHARPEPVGIYGALERWNGNNGPGNLNAHQCMNRAISLAHTGGLGCVALANTNHWMRGGTYGWQAAEAGLIGICWTNTIPNLPPWGMSEPRLGNNPLVIAVPRASGHVVIDMAMSQFSYGALSSYHRAGNPLPVAGGFDAGGRLTTDPGAILETKRLLPIGYWKGSGLALMLDLVAALLSGGKATHQIPPDADKECGISQVFLAFDLAAADADGSAAQIADKLIEHLKAPAPQAGEQARYPGERTAETRKENLQLGVPVDPSIWQRVLDMV